MRMLSPKKITLSLMIVGALMSLTPATAHKIYAQSPGADFIGPTIPSGAHSWDKVFGPCHKPPRNFSEFICIAVDVVQLTITFAASSAVLAFIWGLSKFIFASGNEEKIAEGKLIMRWGLIGLFIMFSIWAIMLMLTLGF